MTGNPVAPSAPPIEKRAAVSGDIENRARNYVLKMPPAISGDGGHTAAFNVARTLVWGFALDAGTATHLFSTAYNPICDPPWSESEVRHKIDSARANPPNRPLGYLLSKALHPDTPTSFRKPTLAESSQISTSRQLDGPGTWLAARLGILVFGNWFGHEVWGCRNPSQQVSELRRLNRQPFPKTTNLGERKSHCLKGTSKRIPVEYIPELPNLRSISLCEGMPDLLALWEQLVWESSIEPRNSNPFDLGCLDHIRTKITCLPLCMLSASPSIASESLPWFAGKSVRIFVHNDEAGQRAKLKWATQLAPYAKKIDEFKCGNIAAKPGADFNDCYSIIPERVLP